MNKEALGCSLFSVSCSFNLSIKYLNLSEQQYWCWSVRHISIDVDPSDISVL